MNAVLTQKGLKNCLSDDYLFSLPVEIDSCSKPSQFMCGNHMSCIDRRNRCDKSTDCADGTDEDNCSKLSPPLNLILQIKLHLLNVSSELVLQSHSKW